MNDPLTWRVRLHFAELEQRCIIAALNGDDAPNNVDAYVKWCRRNIKEIMDGRHDHTYTHRQIRDILIKAKEQDR